MIKLEEIEFHDLPVNKIAFDKFNQNLKIDISIFDEFTESYFLYQLDFQGIKMIYFDKTLLNKHGNLEIYSFEYEYRKGLFYGKIILLLAFGKPSTRIEFEYEQIKIVV